MLIPAPELGVFQARDPGVAMRPHLSSYAEIGVDVVDTTALYQDDAKRFYNRGGHPNRLGIERLMPGSG